MEQDPVLAYGATLLAAAVTDHGVLYVQLGDGDILAVEESGATKRPLPADERLIANHTTSLCQESAVSETRIAVSRETPALILVSTDGYSNSFRTDRDFLKIGSDYLEIIRKQGMDAVSEELPETLAAASAEGSGDDITLGILYRAASLGRTGAMPVLPAKRESKMPWVAGGALLAVGACLLTWMLLPPVPDAPKASKSAAAPVAATPAPKAAKKPDALLLEVEGGGSRFELREGTPILLSAFQPDAPASDQPYAEVRRNAGNGALELVNLSQDTWTVQKPGKPAVEPPVQNGASVTLAPKVKITFRSGVSASVRVGG